MMRNLSSWSSARDYFSRYATTHIEHPDSFSPLLRVQPPPDNLHPTLSSWLKNINKLDSLINRLHQLATSAPADHRSQLLNKVAALRAMFKKQQERCVEFLQLSDDYANKYLLDIDAEVQQQSSVLDNLEERLDAAKKLHGEAVDLQKLYESGTVASMNDLRAAGRRSPVVCRGIILRLLIFRNFAAASTGPGPFQPSRFCDGRNSAILREIEPILERGDMPCG